MTRRMSSLNARTVALLGWPALVLALVAACRGSSDSADSRTSGTDAGTRASEVRAAPAPPVRFALGRPATSADVAAWDLDVNAEGKGLPPGAGTHAKGATVYAQKCALCHGLHGEGLGAGAVSYPKLIGREPREGFPFGRDLAYVKTVGNYWPYSTTVYDYLRRAMPLNAPGSLSPDELYSLTAFLLAENEIIDKSQVMTAQTLPAVRMPARDRFVRDTRPDAPPGR